MTKRLIHVALAILFVIAVVRQVTHSIDTIRDLTGDYPETPLNIGPPFPFISYLNDDAKTAGLRMGDRVVAIGGRTAKSLADRAVAIRTRHTGEILPVQVAREGRLEEFGVRLSPRRARVPPFVWVFAIVSFFLLPWLSLALGFWVTAMRPLDGRAWLAMTVLLGLSQMAAGGNTDPRGWPLPVALASLGLRGLIQSLFPACMLLFGIYFPRRSDWEQRFPWVKWALAIPCVVLAAWPQVRNVWLTVSWVSMPRIFEREPWPQWLLIALQFVCIGGFFAELATKYHDPAFRADDRRRLKTVYWGFTAAMTPLFLLILYSLLIRHREPEDGYLLALSVMALVAVPITLAYVIVVQRALDVRMAVRQGLQYVLAQRGILALQFALTTGAILIAGSLAASPEVNRPGRIRLVALGILAAVVIRKGADRLRNWVDRRFFREAYDTEQILSELSEHVRTIIEKDTLLSTVVRRISESLHVERIAVMLQDGGYFRPAWAAGLGGGVNLEVDGGSGPVAEMLRTRQPVALNGATDGALQQLDAQLLLPLASSKELLGFISLGPKKSEEPYSASDTRLLRAVATQTGLALENSRLSEAVAHEIAQRELLSREIEIAREVQQRLFPQSMPEVKRLVYAGHCRPARGVGGDYYDFLALPGGRFGLVIADVSGKGIPAALLMASLQASVRGQSQTREGEVALLMSRVNRLVFEVSPSNRYATMFYSEYDPATGRLVYSNGGHNPPIVLRGAETIRLEAGGPVVGLFRPAQFEQAEITLQAGDLLVLFTDGVSEAQNPAEDEWGEEALTEAARACGNAPPEEMITRLMQGADAFAAGAPQHDDMTLVVARVQA